MKYNILTIILGLLFSVGLAVLSYFSLALGIALAFSGNGWFSYTVYICGILVIVNLIGLFFVKKKIIVTLIINIVSVVFVLATMIYLVSIGFLTENPTSIGVYVIVFVLGLLTTLFGFIAKRKTQIAN